MSQNQFPPKKSCDFQDFLQHIFYDLKQHLIPATFNIYEKKSFQVIQNTCNLSLSPEDFVRL